MTDPKHAHDTDQGRYYTHPTTGQQLVSVTNVLGTGLAKHGLPAWYAKHAALAAWDLLPLMVTAARTRTDCRDNNPGTALYKLRADNLLCGTCYGCLTRRIKTAAENARDEAADLGTRIHAAAEAHLTGATIQDDPDVAPYLAQYIRFLKDFDVNLTRDVEAAELTVANPTRGYAGTLDILLRLRLDGFIDGKVKPAQDDTRGLWLIDIKSSMTRSVTQTFDSNALQLAALRNATEAWLPDDTVAPMVRGITGCAVLNLRRKDYAFIPIPIGPRERDAFYGALTTATWRHDTWPGDYDHRPVLPSGRIKPKRGTKTTTTSTKAA